MQMSALTQTRIAGALLCAFLLTGCGSNSSESGPPSQTQSQRAQDGTTASAPSSSRETNADRAPEVVAQGLEAPWSIAFYRGSALVSERDSGRILEISPDDPSQARVVTTVPGVATSGEGGLLGLAVHDDVLFAYSTGAEDNRIQRFPLSGQAGAIESGAPDTILDGIARARFHNGGRLAFGPDGMLFATVGDAGVPKAAQDPESLSGSILRITPEGEVPADNPNPDSPVYSYGHRNPQGLAWSEDGTMYASEFGQENWDELNIIEPGGNYGWPDVEGVAADSASESSADFIDPVAQWTPDEASPSGIAIANGAILIANLRGEVLRRVPLDDTGTAKTLYGNDFGRLRDVVVTDDGEVWMLTNNTDGRGDPGADDGRILRVPAPSAKG
ncbi:PQQ-dependent sugar dehydrogenase [Brevibacterium sp. ZH18]|uniref:PQQ-dependent sugar dehydrogenase n=1 Tax=Brevibacterium sp. ZH18 TaxID=2927784 RepID=UPI001F61E0CE|nr:PQQ-dependent sugar dehydrogenase [Brevibacterium sp. ZH18]MCI4009921.1 PQQ-dependent sugar dehydrogenase [Brevibacterium sp. ZH18]